MTSSIQLLICTAAILLVALAPLSIQASDPPTEQELAANPPILFDCFQENFDRIRDYTSLLLKKETIKGREYPEDRIRVRFAKPYRIRLDWTGASRGMWAVYDAGRDPDHIWAKDIGWRGLLGVCRWKVDSKFTRIFHPNRFTVPDISFGGMIDQLRRYFDLAKKLDTLEMEYRGKVEAPLAGVRSYYIHADLSPDPADGFLCRSADMYLDTERCMPVNVTLWGWEGELLGYYAETDLRYNVGLTEADFEFER